MDLTSWPNWRVRDAVAVILATLLVIAAVVLVPGTASWAAVSKVSPTGCCSGITGNVDGDPNGLVDISDLIRLIDYVFLDSAAPGCLEAANVDGDTLNVVDISDVVYLIDYLFLNGPPPAPCASSRLTDGQRQAVFNAIDSVENGLVGKPADSLALLLVAYLKTRPEIDSAGVMDSVSVWAWFKDGRIISIPNNRFPNGTGVGAGSWPYGQVETSVPRDLVIPTRRFPDQFDPTQSPQVTAPSVSATGPELPSTIQARVMSTLGSPCFTVGAPTVKSLLENNGYVTVPSTGSVSSLFNVSGDGVFYIDAHGGPCQSIRGNTHLAIWTATLRTLANDVTFFDQLDREELVYMQARDRNPTTGNCETQWRYAFTGAFVAQYMKFPPNSVILINACLSDSVASLRQGFQLAGASVYCGWTKSVSDPAANKAAEFLVDRMLGANASVLTPKESPPQRPFDILPLWQDMQNRGFDTDPSTGAKLRVEHLLDGFALLAPSIEFLTVDEYTDSLLIAGMFGSDPGSHGRVFVGGTELPVSAWEPQLIHAVIPNSGAGSVGPVWVEVDGLTGPTYSVKRKSNEVNLSEWRDTVTFDEQWADGSMSDSIKLHLHFRDDIHPFRDVPHLPPNKTIVIFNCVQDADGSSKSTGTYTYNGIPGDPWTWTENGGCIIPGLWNHDPSGTFFATGGFNTGTLSVEMHLNASTADCGTMSMQSNEVNETSPISPSIDPRIFEDAKDLIHLMFDKNWNISQKDTTATVCCQDYWGAPFNYPIHLKISPATVSFAPDTTKGE